MTILVQDLTLQLETLFFTKIKNIHNLRYICFRDSEKKQVIISVIDTAIASR